MNWIDVKDKKPELDKQVLVYLKTKTYNPDHFSLGYLDKEDGEWYGIFEGHPLEIDMFFVTHWLELPDKPN